MEGGTGEKTDFTACLHRAFASPYIMRLAFSAGIGGLLFGYDTGTLYFPYAYSLTLKHDPVYEAPTR